MRMGPIPLLGGPENGRVVEVDLDDPPPVVMRRELGGTGQVTVQPMRVWARALGYNVDAKKGNVSPEVVQRYERHVQAMQRRASTQRLPVFYRLARWGPEWDLHYVHPSHPIYALAL